MTKDISSLLDLNLMSPPCCMYLLFVFYNCDMLAEAFIALKDRHILDLWYVSLIAECSYYYYLSDLSK